MPPNADTDITEDFYEGDSIIPTFLSDEISTVLRTTEETEDETSKRLYFEGQFQAEETTKWKYEVAALAIWDLGYYNPLCSFPRHRHHHPPKALYDTYIDSL